MVRLALKVLLVSLIIVSLYRSVTNEGAMTRASLAATISIPSGKNHFGIAADPNKSRVYVGNYESSTVSIIDGTTDQLLSDTIIIRDQPYLVFGLAFNPGNGNIYAASADSVTEIYHNRVVRRIDGIPGATQIAVNPSNQKIYVTDQSRGVTLIHGGESNEVIGRIPVGDGPTAIAFNPYNQKIYVANTGTQPGGGNTVSVIDSTRDDLTPINTITVGKTPEGVAVSSNRSVYVTNADEGTVSVIDGRSDCVTHTISLWDTIGNSIQKLGPRGIAFHPNGNIYIANEASGTAAGSLSVIDSKDNVSAIIPIPGYFLRSVAVMNEKVYVTGANNVFVIKPIVDSKRRC